MGQDVRYEMNLQDLVSPKLVNAEHAANKFEHSLGSLKGALGSLQSLALKAFAVFEVFSVVKESVKDFNDAAQASAQLDASLKSTAHAAGLSREALDKQANSLLETTLFDDDAITKTQSLLLTFTQIKGTIFQDAIPAITDLAQKMGGDLQGATIQVGKALNDPIEGINALRRVGVSFSKDQKNVIENLVKTGQVAKAQQLILKELNTEFGGSAAAAAKAGTGPFTVLSHMLQNVREDIGGALIEVANVFIPILSEAVKLLGATFKFIHDNIGEVVGYVEKALESITERFKSITPDDIFKNLLDGAKQLIHFLKPIFDTLGPILNSVINGLFKVGAALMQFSGPAADLLTWIRDILATVLSYLPTMFDFIYGFVAGLIDVAHTIYVIYEKLGVIWLIGKAFSIVWDVLKNIGNGLKWLWDNILGPLFGKIEQWYEKLKSFLHIKSTADVVTNHAVKTTMDTLVEGGKANPAKAIKSATAGTSSGLGNASAKVTGNKSLTFNIKIDNVVKELNIKTTNLKEGVNRAQSMVAEALLSAITDSQIAAD